MKWLGGLVALFGLFFVVSSVEGNNGALGVVAFGVIILGLSMQLWTIKEIGRERIIIEAAPAGGFNAWYEVRKMTDWKRHFSLSGWGSTREEAEASVREQVAEAKADRVRMENTPTKVVDL